LLEASGKIDGKKVETEYRYGENGNLIEKANAKQVMTYEYTLENHLEVVREKFFTLKN
jgi:hypothetical protein